MSLEEKRDANRDADYEKVLMAPGVDHRATLKNVGMTTWQYIPYTMSWTHAINTGQLFRAWIMFWSKDVWYPALVWEAEFGERWILIVWGEGNRVETGGEAVQMWLERRNQLDLEVGRHFLEAEPDCPFHAKEYQRALQRKSELLKARLSWN